MSHEVEVALTQPWFAETVRAIIAEFYLDAPVKYARIMKSDVEFASLATIHYGRYSVAAMVAAMAHEGRALPGPVHQTEISSECQDLTHKSEILLKMLSDLEERLNIVLRPVDAPPELNGSIIKETGESRSPHADFLRSRNLMLTLALEHLESILSRIEL